MTLRIETMTTPLNYKALIIGSPEMKIELSPDHAAKFVSGLDIIAAKATINGRTASVNIDVNNIGEPGMMDFVVHDRTALANLGEGTVKIEYIAHPDRTTTSEGEFVQSALWQYAGLRKEYAKDKNGALLVARTGDDSTPVGRHNLIASVGLFDRDGWFPERRFQGWNFARYVK